MKAYLMYVRVASKMSKMHEREKAAFELRATRAMFDMDAGSYEFVLSKAAKAFIADNDLGEFSIRFDEAEDWLMIGAPDDFARVLFLTRFA